MKNVWFPICIEDGEHKAKTISFYNDTTKNITAYFDGSNMQKITPAEIQKFIIHLRAEKGFSPRNVHHHYRTLNMIFAYAVRQEILGHTNANTTLNFYVRSDIQQMKAATDKFANAFGL